MMRLRRAGSIPVALRVSIMVAFVVISLCPFAFGQKEKKDLPPRAISVSPEFTGVIVPQGEDVNIDLLVSNNGREDEDIDLSVTSIPKGWKAWLKTYNFGVTGVHLKSDSTD